MLIVQSGCGYVGLTSAVHFALKGHTVLMFDIDQYVVDAINSGNPKSGEFLSYLSADVEDLVKKGLLVATTKWTEIVDAECDAYLLSVPTEARDLPMMDIVKSQVTALVKETHERLPLIIIESTVTPGTCNEIIDGLYNDGFTQNDHYHLAVAPRRDWFADKNKSLANLPRVVGGTTHQATERASKVLSAVCSDIQQTTYDVAELTKSTENAIFNVQISLIENLALTYPHIDINEVVRLATTHWRLTPLSLSAGISGRCIPLALHYLEDGTLVDADKPSFMKTVMKQDKLYREKIAEVAVDYVNFLSDQTLLSEENKFGVAVLGLGYRKDFNDIGGSPGLFYARELMRTVAKPKQFKSCHHVGIIDPIVSVEVVEKLNLNQYDTNIPWRVLILATPHTNFVENAELFLSLHGQGGCIVIDPYGAWQKHKELMEKENIHYVRVGSPFWTEVSLRLT